MLHLSRRVRFLAIAIALALSTSIVGGASRSAAREKEKASRSVPAGTTLRVADQFDYLQTPLAISGKGASFPYKVEYSSFIGGPPMLQAFKAGAIDIGWTKDTPLILAHAQGQEVVAVAAYAPQASGVGLVAAPGQNDIKGWKSLKGKKVAFHRGTVLQAVLMQGLSSVGLSLDDIEPVYLTSPNIVQALQNGSVPAAVLAQPIPAKYLADNPGARWVTEGNDVTNRLQLLIASRAALDDPAKAKAIADYIGRLQQAFKWINAHPTEWAQAFHVKLFQLTLPDAQKLVQRELPYCFHELPGDLLDPQQKLANLFWKAGEIPAKLKVKSEFDGRFNRVLEKTECP